MAATNVIVFPTDFSPRSLEVLPWLRRMTDLLQAEVHVIYVIEEPQIYTTLDMGPVPIPSATDLTDTARDPAASLLIMTTHGYSGVKHMLLGSTTESVLRQSTCPVLSIRAG